MGSDMQLQVLTGEDVSIIFDKCVQILSTKGVVVNHKQGLNLLHKAGAQVNFNDQLVKFPKNVITQALKTVPRSFTLAGGDARPDLVLPHPENAFYATSFMGSARYIDPSSNSQRDATLSDVVEMCRLMQLMDEVSICSYAFPTDVPSQTADVHGLKAAFESTTKPIKADPYTFESVEYLFELIKVVAGSTENLIKKPNVYCLCTPLSPLQYKKMDVEAIIQCCRHGVPVMACSPLTAGGSAPVTMAGKILLAASEILAILVMSQLLKPGTPVTGAFLSWELDMGTGLAQRSNVEAMISGVAGAQFIKETFHIPIETLSFGTDSHLVDGQSTMESALVAQLMAVSRTCDLLGGAGGSDSGQACSPIQLIIDNTLASMLKRIITGLKINDDTIAWEEINGIEHGESFITLPHTLKHCHDALRPRLLNKTSFGEWVADGSKGLHARVLDEYLVLKDKLTPVELSDDVRREIQKIVKRADENLIK